MTRMVRYSLFVWLVAVVLAFVPGVAARVQDASTKTIFVSVLDSKGVPVTDIKQEELGVFEDGKQRAVVSAKLATSPLSIVMMADTTKEAGGAGLDRRSTSAAAAGEMIRDVRAAYSAFVKQINAASPESEMALMEFGQASIMITDFTKNGADLEKGITRLFPKPDAASVLLEAILESSKELSKRPNLRRAMISINVEPGDEQSREPPNKILLEVLKSRAVFYSVSLQKGDQRNQSRGIVLDGIAGNTGGKRDNIVGQSALVGILKGYGEALLAQYEITYTRPGGPAPQAIQVGTLRSNMKILASKYPPQ